MSTLGTDFSGAEDLDPTLSASKPRRALLESIVRRLSTPSGSVPDWPGYGYDLTSLIGTSINSTAVKLLVRAQCLAEEEVISARVSVVRSNESYDINVEIRDGDGPFDFTFEIDELSVSVVIPGES